VGVAARGRAVAEPAQRDPPLVANLECQGPAGPARGGAPARVGGLVEFKVVSFSYDGKRPAVADLNFTALPGETIALVGPTGAGKSTALALLHRRDQQLGVVEADDREVGSRAGQAETSSRRADGRVQTFRIVGEDEADPKAGSISFASPVATSLMGKAVGETAGSGESELEIIAIA